MADLDTELELIASSLLPEETLSDPSSSWPREIVIANNASLRSLNIEVKEAYPDRSAVTVSLKGNDIGREEATTTADMISEYMNDWDNAEDYPLYQLLTTHLLPLLAPTTTAPATAQPVPSEPTSEPSIPHHALLTSHHLLSPTKRKNFLALASQLSLTGFSKVGHPGIYYAIGDAADLAEWVREVKSWNWLALRVRVGIEPVPGTEAEGELEGKGKENGARGGKGRGDWVELEKIGEAVEWMRKRGREHLLHDIGIGGGGSQ